MSRIFIVLVVATGTVAAVAARQQPAFKAGVDTVSIYATVVDRSGRLVPNLTRDDFDVFDNGARQELTHFAHDVQPSTVVIMLDRSGSMVRSFDLVRDAAAKFVSKLLDTDRARIGSFSRRIQIDPAGFTNDRKALVRILHEELQEAGPSTPLWNAASEAMASLSHEDGRRVLLVFTDGVDSPVGAGPHVSLAEARDRSRAAGVMVYGIGLIEGCNEPDVEMVAGTGDLRLQRQGRPGRGSGRGGRTLPGTGRGRGGRLPVPPIGRVPRLPEPTRPGDDRWTRPTSRPCTPQKPDKGLKDLAVSSGGSYVELSETADLESTFASVADELHQQYLLAYTSPQRDGKTHTIEVRTRRKDLTVRARNSYVAPK
jgi:VWFA-related protein